MRADAGFCLLALRALWEQLRLPYVVVAQLRAKLPPRKSPAKGEKEVLLQALTERGITLGVAKDAVGL